MSILALAAFTDNYIWLIVNEKQHSFICIDPGDAEPVLQYAKANSLSLRSILLTHHHPDHTNGVSQLLQAFPGVSIYGSSDSRMPENTIPIQNEDVIHIEPYSFRVLSTPGHTASHICYQEPNCGWLFCGDTLFSGGCGRIFDGTAKSLHHSLQVLKNLPNDTRIYCGHEYTRKNLRFAAMIEPQNEDIASYAAYLEKNPSQCSLPSTVALEKKINPFLRTNEGQLSAFAKKYHIPIHNSLALFTQLRLLKDTW